MSNLETWVDPRIQAVRVSEVRCYLLNHGWQPQPYPRAELLVFQGPPDDTGTPVTLVLPSSETYADYRLRLTSLLTAVSILEDRHPVEVLNDILRLAEYEAANGAAAEPPSAKVSGK